MAILGRRLRTAGIRSWTLALFALGIGVGAAATAAADTIYTGILSTDTVKLMCSRAGARYMDFEENGYGCHNARVTITCRSSLECVSRVRDLNSHMGEPLNAYMRNHGMRKAGSTGSTP